MSLRISGFVRSGLRPSTKRSTHRITDVPSLGGAEPGLNRGGLAPYRKRQGTRAGDRGLEGSDAVEAGSGRQPAGLGEFFESAIGPDGEDANGADFSIEGEEELAVAADRDVEVGAA